MGLRRGWGWLLRPWSWLKTPDGLSVIPTTLWAQTLTDYPFLARLPAADREALRSLCAQFLRDKEFHGARSFEVTDAMALAVAAQACLPVLHLGLQPYAGFVGIVIHEGPVRARREAVDESGLVHTWEEELVGEAMGDGPVMLSWHEGVASGAADASAAFNVVIHEFVHLLDALDGDLDGTPPLPAARRAQWQRTMQEAYDRFDERQACGYSSIIDPYGAQDVVEFFAVTSEAFFTQPEAFRLEQPELYALYRGFYRQDPAQGTG